MLIPTIVCFCCKIYLAALQLLESYSVHFKKEEKSYSDSRETNAENPVIFNIKGSCSKNKTKYLAVILISVHVIAKTLLAETVSILGRCCL